SVPADVLRTDFLPYRSPRWFAVVDARGRVAWTHKGALHPEAGSDPGRLLGDPELLGKRAVAAPGLQLKPGRGLRPRDVEAEPGAAGDSRLDRIRPAERGTAGGGGGWPVPAFVALGGLAGPQVDGAAVDGAVAGFETPAGADVLE